MSGGVETERTWGDADTLLSIYPVSWSSSDSLLTKLDCFSKGKREPVFSTILHNNRKYIRMTARRGYREEHLSKSHFLSNNGSRRRLRNRMEWKWDRRDREARQAGTYEWMKHNVWQTWWKNRHVRVTDLKDLQQRRQITPLITNTYSMDAGQTVERGILASSDRCPLNADESGRPLTSCTPSSN